jgi:hypothetical protein
MVKDLNVCKCLNNYRIQQKPTNPWLRFTKHNKNKRNIFHTIGVSSGEYSNSCKLID